MVAPFFIIPEKQFSYGLTQMNTDFQLATVYIQSTNRLNDRYIRKLFFIRDNPYSSVADYCFLDKVK